MFLVPGSREGGAEGTCRIAAGRLKDTLPCRNTKRGEQPSQHYPYTVHCQFDAAASQAFKGHGYKSWAGLESRSAAPSADHFHGVDTAHRIEQEDSRGL